MRRAAAETDEKKRLALYEQAHKLVVDQVVMIPVYNRESYILVKPKVQNLVVTPMDGAIKGDYNFHKTFIAN